MSGTNGRQRIDLLFVDDDEGNFTALEPRLTSYFDEQDCPVNLTFEAEPDKACALIANRQRPFQVVIADLLFAPQGSASPSEADLDARGHDVIRAARRASDKTVIVAITQGMAQLPELRDDAEVAGADFAIFRSALLNKGRAGGPGVLLGKIYDQLCQRELIETGPVIEASDEPGIQAVQEEVGAVTLRLLLADALSGSDSKPERAAVSFVAPGASGAYVVHAKVTLSHGRRRSMLLKLAKDGAALEAECRRLSGMSGLYRPDLVVPPIWTGRMPIGPKNLWSAIAYNFADGAVTLKDWLSGSCTTDEVEYLMELLFFDRGLATGYQQSEPDHDRRPLDALLLPVPRRIRLRIAVEELGPMLNDPRAAAIADAPAVLEELERFSRTASFGGLSREETPTGLRLVEAHGDLHCNNIMVATGRRGGNPAVIDLADFGQHHWATDVAKLTVDILLACVDRGVESTLWGRFARWRELARSLGHLPDPLDDRVAENRPALSAFRWVAANREELMPPLCEERHRWEWHIALAQQFLHGAIRKAEPHSHPKRALALVAAFDQLRLARQAIPEPKPTY